LRFSVEWKDDVKNAAAEERATVADFRLLLDEKNVTMHLRGNKNFEYVTIALYALAEGLARDWWILFGGRDRELSLIRHRGGYAVPDIRLRYDGAAFEIVAHQRTYINPDIRFWSGPCEVLSRKQAESEIGGFIEFVLDRLERKNIRDTGAALRWARVQASRESPEEAQFCEAAGALGLDPYQIEAAQSDTIQTAASIFDSESLTEFLAGAAEYDQRALLDWVRTVENRPRHTSRVGELAAIAKAAAEQSPPRMEDRSWSLGYRRARAMRRVLGLKLGERFSSFKHLARTLGASDGYELAASVDGIRALRSDHNEEIRIHIRNHGSLAEAFVPHLFTFARAVGDATCFLEESKTPINDLHSASRQAAGRAFAAEFLAPIDEIESMHKDGHDFVSIADEFVVSTAVIAHQMENAARIRKACE
jgi:hypothetical protein